MINESKKILLITHRKPDADTIGAALAFNQFLKSMNKEGTVACIDEVPQKLSFLPWVDTVQREFCLEDYDLMIFLDVGASYMTSYQLVYDDFFTSGLKMVNIDHHASNDYFGDLNIVEIEEASATAILYKIFREWGIVVDGDMATCLLAGLYNDTGSFMHSNTDKAVLEIAADLLESGARISDISRNMFNSTDISTLKLWGKVLENAYVTEDKVVMSLVKENDYDFRHVTSEALSGVVDYLNMVPDGRMALLINEDGKGNVKGSFRTRRDDVDVSKIAAKFGGGGHSKASGFFMPGKLEEKTSYSIVSEDLSKKTLKF